MHAGSFVQKQKSTSLMLILKLNGLLWPWVMEGHLSTGPACRFTLVALILTK